MKIQTLPNKLPVEFYQFFWDVEAKKVDPSAHPYYVINRLLDKGDLDAARWVLRNFPKELIIDTIKKMRDFSPWNAVFWARFLGVPREEVKCLQPHYLSMRRAHWPY